MLDWHLTRLAPSLAFFRVGRRIEIRSAIIPITTSSSTSVNPRLRRISGVPFIPAQSSHEKSEIEIYHKLSAHTIENPAYRANEITNCSSNCRDIAIKQRAQPCFWLCPQKGRGPLN